MQFILLTLGLLALDQWSKWQVLTKMVQGESIPLIKGVFHLTYVRNPGAAFGMLPDKIIFFVVVTVLVVAGLGFYATRIGKDKILLKTGLALMVGGAVGNLIDRVRFGHVIDFFDFIVWPVFNVADVGICIGVGILFLELLRSDRASEI